MQMIFMEDDGFDLNVMLGVLELLAELIEIMNINQERREIPRNQHYVETVVPGYDDILFREHFRMSRKVFQNLSLLVVHTRPGLRNARIELNKKLLLTIWILAKQESFSAYGDRFGLARSTGHYVLQEILSVLLEIMPQYITWPNDHRAAVNIFHKRSDGFPGVIGASGRRPSGSFYTVDLGRYLVHR